MHTGAKNIKQITENYPNDLKDLVEEALVRYFPQADSRLRTIEEAMAYSLFSPGKRFRPVLMLLCAEAVGADPAGVLPFASAIEFIHTYSLIHDDLPAIDNDTLRRGRPTCHVKFGEDIAILAGDALYAEAFVLVLKEQPRYTNGQCLLEALEILAVSIGIEGMVGGQAVDIAATGREVSRSTLEFIHNRKTGSLIKASAVCGAVLGGGADKQIDAVSAFAGNLGLAFQITDDVLDVVGEQKETGKRTGSDEDNRKMTFVAKWGVQESLKAAEAAIGRAVGALAGSGLKTGRLETFADFVLRRTS